MKLIKLSSHIRPLTQVRFNRDSDLLFTVGKNNSAHVWRTENGEKLGSYEAHLGAIWCVTTTGDTHFVVTGGADSFCKVWDARTGQVLRDIETKTSVRSVSFNNEDNMLTLSTDFAMNINSKILSYDLRCKEQLSFFQNSEFSREKKITSALYAASGIYFITAHANGKVIQWCSKTGKILLEKTLHENTIFELQRSVDEDFIVSASKDTTSKLFSPYTLDVIKVYKTPQPVNSAAISSLKDHVLLGGGQDHHEVTTTDTHSGQFFCRFYHKIYEVELGKIKGHFGPINTIAISPNGKYFTSGGEDGIINFYHFDKDYYDFEYKY